MSFHMMISIIFFIHDPFHIILPDFTSFLLTETQLSITSSHALPPSTSLLSVFNPFTGLSITFGQFFYSVSAYLAFSLITFETAFFAIFFIPLYFILFFSVLSRHIALCECVFLETTFFTSSFHHYVCPLLLLFPFFPHTSSHAFNIPSLKCSYKFGTPTLTNSFAFSANHFLMFESFSKLIFLLSVHVLIDKVFYHMSFYLSVLQTMSTTEVCFITIRFCHVFFVDGSHISVCNDRDMSFYLTFNLSMIATWLKTCDSRVSIAMPSVKYICFNKPCVMKLSFYGAIGTTSKLR